MAGSVRLSSMLRMRPADANVVVEIKHWKSKEKRFSVLAWSFLPAHVLVSRADAGGNGALKFTLLQLLKTHL